MAKCKYCGQEIGFSITGYHRECYKKHLSEVKAEAEEENYQNWIRLMMKHYPTQLKSFEGNENTVVYEDVGSYQRFVVRYAKQYGYEVSNITNDGDPDIPITTVIFKKTPMPMEWECPYCKTINRGNFCSNCGSPRKR
jgi:hypothetical protein